MSGRPWRGHLGWGWFGRCWNTVSILLEYCLLSLPLLLVPVADVSVPESAATPSMGEQFPVSSVVSPDLSQEGPIDAGLTVSGVFSCVG